MKNRLALLFLALALTGCSSQVKPISTESQEIEEYSTQKRVSSDKTASTDSSAETKDDQSFKEQLKEQEEEANEKIAEMQQQADENFDPGSFSESQQPEVGVLDTTTVKPGSLENAHIPTYVNGQTGPVVDLGAPIFSTEELSAPYGTEIYSELDDLGRVGPAFAILGPETQPADGEERGDISSIKPTGWIQHQYSTDLVDGGYIYNRSHLIGWQLSAENDNPKNLMTGTRYMNVAGMLPFENLVDEYIERTGHHVAYKVTPHFTNNNLLANGVQIEMQSIEDGEISHNVYCYNVQPYITIDYDDGENYTQ